MKPMIGTWCRFLSTNLLMVVKNYPRKEGLPQNGESEKSEREKVTQ